MRRAEQVDHDPHTEPAQRELALGLTYPRAIERAGGVPVVIPPLAHDAIASLLGGLDGLCLSGGPDIDPSTYGAQPHAALGITEPDLDRFEIALVHAALERGLPVLGICRGLQTLNVALGGTLVQDLPSERPGPVRHRQTEPGREATHGVALQAGPVADALGARDVQVNSFHHQAVDRLGDGLVVQGHAADGVVEAVALEGAPFVLAVQWHAESLVAAHEQTRMVGAFGAGAAERRDLAAPAGR
jgi:putative glutamine amidotransferase